MAKTQKRTTKQTRKTTKSTERTKAAVKPTASSGISKALTTTKETLSDSIAFVGEKAKALAHSFFETSDIPSLQKLFKESLADLYSAEKQLLQALPKMAEKANDASLSSGFRKHLKQTEGHVERLEKVAKALRIDISGKTCKAMKGLIAEGDEVVGKDGPPAIIDTALIAAAQRVEHYEIAGYGCARAIAEELGLQGVARILQQTLDEEGATDKALTEIAEGKILGLAHRVNQGREGKRTNPATRRG